MLIMSCSLSTEAVPSWQKNNMRWEKYLSSSPLLTLSIEKTLAPMRVIIFLGHMSTESFSNLVKTYLNADSRVVLHTSNLGSMEIGNLLHFLIFSSQNAQWRGFKLNAFHFLICKFRWPFCTHHVKDFWNTTYNRPSLKHQMIHWAYCPMSNFPEVDMGSLPYPFLLP